MSESLKQPDNYLGDMLSISFPECSIAAAELNRAVAEHMESAELKQVEMLDSDRNTELQTVAVIGTPDSVMISPAGMNPVELVFVQPIESTTKPGVIERSGLLRRQVKISDEETTWQRVGEPVLGAFIEGRMVLPLATFARRENGLCSYVQIGSEMDDDSLFVTTVDDQSSRLKIVEAFRDILTNDRQRWGLENHSGSKRIIGSLFQLEMGRRAEQLGEASERLLVNRCFNLVKKSDKVRRLVAIEDDGQLRQQSVVYHQVLAPCRLPDSRQAELILARSENSDPGEPDRLELLTVTRGNLAIKLADIPALTRRFEFTPGLPEQVTRLQLVQDLMVLLNRSGVTITPYMPLDSEKEEPSRDLAMLLLADMKETYMYFEFEDDYVENKLKKFDSKEKDETRKALRFNLDFPGIVPLDPEQQRVVDMVLEERVNERAYNNVALRYFAVEQRLIEITGPTEITAEALFKKLNNVVVGGGCLEGVIEDVAIGRTKGDADVRADVTQSDDGTYTLLLSARPAAMTGEQFKVISHLDVNVGIKNDGLADAERNRALLQILLKLKVPQAA